MHKKNNYSNSTKRLYKNKMKKSLISKIDLVEVKKQWLKILILSLMIIKEKSRVLNHNWKIATMIYKTKLPLYKPNKKNSIKILRSMMICYEDGFKGLMIS